MVGDKVMNSTVRPTKASSAPIQLSNKGAQRCGLLPGCPWWPCFWPGWRACCRQVRLAAVVTPPITITVVSQTVLLQGAAPTVIVPIRLDADNSRKVSSAAFSLDYDSACLAIDPVDANQDGVPDAVSVRVPADFEKSVSLNAADAAGDLDIAIWDPDRPVAELAAPTIIVAVTFNLLPDCQKDGFTSVNFSTKPEANTGQSGRPQIPSTPVSGTVTVDWNHTATAITLTPNTIAENQLAGTTVGTLASNDPDTDDTFIFSLVSGDGGTDNGLFTVNAARSSPINRSISRPRVPTLYASRWLTTRGRSSPRQSPSQSWMSTNRPQPSR